MTLLANAPLNYDYYCFADQDDIWKKEKIIKAIQVIKKNNEPCGYCSKQLYVDENLKSVSGIYQNIDELPVGKYKYQWSIATGLIALGCTFVWNKSLQDIIATNDVSTYNVAHDVFLSIFIPCVGELFKDNKGYLLYRQHNNNTSGNKYRKKYMIDRIIKTTIFNNKPDNHNYRVRRIILDEYNNYVNEEAKLMLEDSCKYKGSLKSKAKLLVVSIVASCSYALSFYSYWMSRIINYYWMADFIFISIICNRLNKRNENFIKYIVGDS